MSKWAKVLAVPLLAVVGLLSGCATSNSMVEIHGDTWFRERMVLPPEAVLTVQLQDVSRADAPAIVMAELARDDVSTPSPFSFTMDKDQFVKGHRYTIAAKITLNDKLLFINTQSYPVDLASQAPISVMLQKVGR